MRAVSLGPNRQRQDARLDVEPVCGS